MASTPDISRLYDDHAQAVFAFLENLVRNEADTRDIMQELFVKVARRPAMLKDLRYERGFLLRMAHNLAIDLFRRRGARERQAAQLALEPKPLFEASADA